MLSKVKRLSIFPKLTVKLDYFGLVLTAPQHNSDLTELDSNLIHYYNTTIKKEDSVITYEKVKRVFNLQK